MTFQTQTAGPGSTQIQISGDNNTVTMGTGSTKLTLARPQARKATPKTELELLRVDIRATSLVGRTDDLAALEAWRDSDRPIALRCLIARAGTGKTRLAVELCERSETAGWKAGFVQLETFPAFVQAADHWRWDEPTLIVVDYAASLARDLRSLLEILAQGDNAGRPKLRILLLERHADPALGWWSDLMRPGSFSAASPDEYADPPEPIALQSLGKLDDRRALLAETMRLAGAIAEPPVSAAPPAPGADPAFDQRLSDDTIDNEPLFLMMAGVEAVYTSAPKAVRLDRTVLADRAAGLERKRLDRLAASWRWPEGLLPHLALCVTLQGGGAAETAAALLREECAAMEFTSPGPAHQAIERLADAMPASATTEIDGLRPDLVGEAFVLALMRKLTPSIQTAIVDRAWARAPTKVAASLVRLAQDFARGDAGHEGVLWLGHGISRIGDISELMAVANTLPHETIVLREVAAATSDRIVDVFRALSPKPARPRPRFLSILLDWLRRPASGGANHSLTVGPNGFLPELASSLSNRAVRLAALGQREAALDAAREAANLYRELAAQKSDAFRPYLALSLNNLANRLSEVGQREAAFDAAREGADLYSELAAQRPDAFRPDLAMSLNNLANRLSEVGQREAALDAARKAAAVYRELAAQRPDAFRPYLALLLNNLAACLSEVGQREAALDAAREAVNVYRELTAQRPDAFRSHLAMSLNNLASMLNEVGQREAALDAACEAADLYRELAAQRPDAFRPYLAGSLNNFANRLSAVGQREAALDAAREAAVLRRELAAQWPNAFRSDFALSLNNLANRLREVGQREAALDAAREAVDIRRSLVAQRPDLSRHDLATSLAVLALCFAASDQPHEARASSEEAIDTLKPAFFARPVVFSGLMMAMVRDHLAHCDAAGREPDAARLNPIIEALNKLTGDDP